MTIILECRTPTNNPMCWAFVAGLTFMLMNDYQHHHVGNIEAGVDVDMERIKVVYQSHYGEWWTYLKPGKLTLPDLQKIRLQLFKNLDDGYDW